MAFERHGIMLEQSNKKISVFVPTYNGEKYLEELIRSVLQQKLPNGYELEFLITDSGSSDRTVEIINGFRDDIQLQQIPNTEFGHGKTRQQAAEIASGEYILFLSQDATPHSDRWIINMLEPFFVSDKIGCVFGRQIPRPSSVPTIKREVATVFAGIGSPDQIMIHREKSLVDGTISATRNTFFSDVNSAIRKDLVKTVPFRDVKYAEDQALADDMLSAGYLKAYAPLGAVWHSNEYTAKEYYHRKFDEYIGLQEGTGTKLSMSLRELLFGWIRPTLADWKFTRHDSEYNKRAKLKFSVLAPIYNFYQILGKYHAIKFLNDDQKRQEISLESRRKK